VSSRFTTGFCTANRASAKLIGITLRASRGACVLHRSGRLAVELCSLELNTAGGLDHLFAAIVTTAAGALEAPLGPLQLRPARPAAALGAKLSAGVLTVTETCIQVSFTCLAGSNLLDGAGRQSSARCSTLSSCSSFAPLLCHHVSSHHGCFTTDP